MFDPEFDMDFMTKEEVEEMYEALADILTEDIEADELRTSVINPVKLKQIQFTYNALRFMTKGSGAKVSYKLHEPYNSVGYVSVVGKNISFLYPEWMAKISELASNVEIYPKTNGTVQMNFAFHELTIPIE